ILTVLSALAEARCRPSGLNATPVTQFVWPERVRISCPVSGFQIFTVPSELAEASRRPSGLNATLATSSVWPRKRRSSCPVLASQTLISPRETGHGIQAGTSPLNVSERKRGTLAELPEARRRPSGLNATHQTFSVWPFSV